MVWHGVLEYLFVWTVVSLLEHTPDDHPNQGNASEESIANATSQAALCGAERSRTGVALLFHRQTSKCYEEGGLAPCGPKMRFYSLDGAFGECDCDQLSKRMLVYHNKSDGCHEIFTQGPCRPGKWIDVTRDWFPICTRTLCPSPNSVRFQGKCVELDDEQSEECRVGFKVGFERGKRLPTCVPLVEWSSSILAIIALPATCSPGTYRSITGRCQPAFEFD